MRYRKNSHSSGPKTPNGKRNSSRNAIKHGFFAQEFLLSDAEKVEFQMLHCKIREQHRPTTALQVVAVEEIACCCWRCKLAMRLEARRLRILLDPPQDQEVQPEQTQDPARMTWYIASRQDLRAAIRFLSSVKQDFERNKRVPEEWKEVLDKVFGVGCYESWTKWIPMSFDAAILAKQLTDHARIFKIPLPPLPHLDEKEIVETVVDPLQSFQMVSKLMDEKLQHLEDLNRSWGQRGSESVEGQHASPVDFAPRYFTTASRDLHRAVEWFVYLKKENL